MAVKVNAKKPALKERIAIILKKEYDTTSIKFFVRFLFFITIWLYLWFGYGDVLYQIQDRSLWFFASPKDFANILLPSDILTYTSRFLLTFFTLPWLGGLILAVFITSIELLTSSILKPKSGLFFISFIPSLLVLLFITSSGYQIYYQYENSIIFKVIILTVIVLALLALTRRAIIGNSTSNHSTGIITCKNVVIGLALIIISTYAITKYANKDEGFRSLTKQEYYADQQDWFEVAKIAEESKHMTVAISAYHAIALVNTGQLGDRLFNISYDYCPITIPCKEGSYASETLLYNSEINLYSGLVLPAYHSAMEENVICNVSKHFLKIMVKCAILNKEYELAKKLLSIISKIPFEGTFTKRFECLIEHPEDINKDPELANIRELIPEYDSFEQTFGKPLYLNFYSMRTSGPEKAIDLCMAACLFKKDAEKFMKHCDAITNRRIIPKHFQEAIIMMGMGQRPNYLKKFKIPLDAYNVVKDFYQDLNTHSKDSDKGKSALKAKYGNTYMYYNTFENLPE